MKKILIPLLFICFFASVKAQVINSQSQKYLKRVWVEGPLFSDSVMVASDSTNRVPNSAWIKRLISTGATYTAGYGMGLTAFQFKVDSAIIVNKTFANRYPLKSTTIAGFDLRSNITLASHTPNYGLSGSAYNGSTAQGWVVDSTIIASKVWSKYAMPGNNIVNSGAVGNGTTNNDAAINGQLATRDIYVPPGTFLVSTLTNSFGNKISGSGLIVKNITGGQQQLNLGIDDSRLTFGSEYLQWYRGRLAAGNTVKAYLTGNSTYAGSSVSAPYVPSTLMATFGTLAGINRITYTNKGRSGITLHDFRTSYFATDTVGSPDLIILGYIINRVNADASVMTIQQFEVDAEYILTTLRARKGQGALSIILKTDNSTSDTPNGRDEMWAEQCSRVYRALARKYQCGFIDTYKTFVDSRNGAAGFTYDDPYGDGRAIHPLDQTNVLIWGQLFDYLYPKQFSAQITNSKFINQGNSDKAVSKSDLPLTYPIGISINRAPSTSGWDVNGVALTIANSDPALGQFNWSYAATNPDIYFRSGNTNATNVWSNTVKLWHSGNLTPDVLSTAGTVVLRDASSNIAANFITSSDGTTGLVSGPYGSGRGGLWAYGITRTTGNYGFLTNGVQTYINGTTEADINVNNSIILAALSTGVNITGNLSATNISTGAVTGNGQAKLSLLAVGAATSSPVTWQSGIIDGLQIGSSGALQANANGANQIGLANNFYRNTSGINTYITSNSSSQLLLNGSGFSLYFAPSGTAGTGFAFGSSVFSVNNTGNITAVLPAFSGGTANFARYSTPNDRFENFDLFGSANTWSGANNFTSNLSAKNIYSTSATPTIVVGAGAGTGATVSVVGTNQDGVITLNTGTAPSTTVLFTVTMNGFSYPVACTPVITLSTFTAIGTGVFFQSQGTGANTWIASVFNQALTASATYTFNYHNGGN